MILPLLIVLILAVTVESRADIYRYLDEEGVECYTDAPVTGGATLIMRDRRASRPAGVSRKVPKHLAATGIGERSSVAPLPAPNGEGASLPVQGRITSLVGLRHDPLDGTVREHRGVDIAVPAGTPVRPVAPGKVAYAGVRPGYGNLVIVEHGDGTLTLYAHNATNLVAEGDQVAGDTPIALSGSTGRSTGPHLHFEAWRDGANVTASYIPGSKGDRIGPADPRRSVETIRRILQPDGSILLTNLP